MYNTWHEAVNISSYNGTVSCNAYNKTGKGSPILDTKQAKNLVMLKDVVIIPLPKL